jgi:acylphosphatase
VGFRDFARRAAGRLGLRGYARNRADGGLEIEAEGSEEQLARLRQQVAEGPAFARVDRIEDLPATDGPLADPFAITR